MIATIGLYAAALCGLFSALAGNRTAWPLLASLALCIALDAWGVPFNFFFWVMIDFAVICVIVHLDMTRKKPRASTYSDILIVALFPVAWGFYVVSDPQWRFWGGWAVVVTQFLMSVPTVLAGRTIRKWTGAAEKGGDHMLNWGSINVGR